MTRRDAFVFTTVSISVVALVVALVLQLFVLNPKADRNRVEIVGIGTVVRRVICAQAGTTANATRIRLRDVHGKPEGVKHYLTRMLAQRYTLQLSKGLNCDSAPGFPPYEVQLRRALKQIDGILKRLQVSVKETAFVEPHHPGHATRELFPTGVIPPVSVPTSPQIVGVGPSEQSIPDTPIHSPPSKSPPKPLPPEVILPPPSPAPEEGPGKGKGPPSSLPEVVEEVVHGVGKGVGHDVEEIVPLP